MGAFERAAKVYEEFGADEPFYAVLSYDAYKKERLDVDAFYAHGEQQIAGVMKTMDDRGIVIPRQRALDFGCGTGRLTNALAGYFDEVVGIDVSSTMIETARKHQRRPNCQFVLNKQDNLSIFPDDHFDFIYSDITIQHIPSPASERYVQEFIRVLSPDGLAIFLIPDGPAVSSYSLSGQWQRFYRELLRPALKRLRGKHAVQIHYIPRGRVDSVVNEAGGMVLETDVHPEWASKNKPFKPIYYWATTEAA